MPSANRSRKGKRERGRDGHGGAPNHSKAAQPSGDKRAPTTTDNEPTSKQATNKSLKSCTPNANVHHANGEDEMTTTVCWICAEPIKYYSLPSCNHRTCHVCALRLRALYEKVECAFCKVGVLIHCFFVLFAYLRLSELDVDVLICFLILCYCECYCHPYRAL